MESQGDAKGAGGGVPALGIPTGKKKKDLADWGGYFYLFIFIIVLRKKWGSPQVWGVLTDHGWKPGLIEEWGSDGKLLTMVANWHFHRYLRGKV